MNENHSIQSIENCFWRHFKRAEDIYGSVFISRIVLNRPDLNISSFEIEAEDSDIIDVYRQPFICVFEID